MRKEQGKDGCLIKLLKMAGRGKKDKTQKSGCILNWADFGIVNINRGKRILRVEMKT